MNHTHDEKCDACGDKIEFGNLGQATADTVLCSECLERAAVKAVETQRWYDLGDPIA